MLRMANWKVKGNAKSEHTEGMITTSLVFSAHFWRKIITKRCKQFPNLAENLLLFNVLSWKSYTAPWAQGISHLSTNSIWRKTNLKLSLTLYNIIIVPCHFPPKVQFHFWLANFALAQYATFAPVTDLFGLEKDVCPIFRGHYGNIFLIGTNCIQKFENLVCSKKNFKEKWSDNG